MYRSPMRVVHNAPHAPPHLLSTICRRPPSPDGRIACVRPVAQNENSLRSNSLASDVMRPRMMRIRFGLILKITARTKSYTPFKLQYFTKRTDSQAKLSLFSGSHPNNSDLNLQPQGPVPTDSTSELNPNIPIQTPNAPKGTA